MAMNMKMCGCCVLAAGYDFLTVGHGPDYSPSEEDYHATRDGLLVTRSLYRDPDSEIRLLYPTWSITLPVVDDSFSEKNLVWRSHTFGASGIVTASIASPDLDDEVTDYGSETAGWTFDEGVDSPEADANATSGDYDATGVWTAPDPLQPVFKIFPVNLAAQTQSGEIEATARLTTTEDTKLLIYPVTSSTGVAEGTYYALDLNLVPDFFDKSDLAGDFDPNAHAVQATYYGDKIGWLYRPGTGIYLRPAQYCTFDVTDGTIEFQSSTADEAMIAAALALAPTEAQIQTSIDAPGTSPGAGPWPTAKKEVVDFAGNSSGSLLPFTYVQTDGGAFDGGFGSIDYPWAVFHDGIAYYNQGEAKPIMLARGKEGFGVGFEITTASGTNVLNETTEITGATARLKVGAITDNVVGGTTFFTSSSGYSGSFPSANSFFLYFLHVLDVDAVDTGPSSTFSVVLATASEVQFDPAEIDHGVDDNDYVAHYHADNINDTLVDIVNETYDINSDYPRRYETWYINGVEKTIDRLAYLVASGSAAAHLTASKVFVHSDGKFFVTGRYREVELERDSLNRPILPYEPSYDPSDPAFAVGDFSSNSRDYVAYYEVEEGDPVLKWVRMDGVTSIGGFIPLIGAAQLNEDWFYWSEFVVHRETGLRISHGQYGIDGRDNMGSPYTSEKYTTLEADSFPFESAFTSSNWTTMNYDATGVPYREVGGVQEALNGPWGVVPVDEQTTSIDDAEFSSYLSPLRDGVSYFYDWAAELHNPAPIESDDFEFHPIATKPITLEEISFAELSDASTNSFTWPVDVAADQLAILIVAGPHTITTPAGWTSGGFASDGSAARVRMYRRVLDGTESGSFALTIGASEANDNMVVWFGRADGFYGSPAPEARSTALAFTKSFTAYIAEAGGTWSTIPPRQLLRSGTSAASGIGTAFDYWIGEYDVFSGLTQHPTHSVDGYTGAAFMVMNIYPPMDDAPNFSLSATGVLQLP